MELDKDRLLDLYSGYTSVLGPYDRPDGRKHVVLNNANASKGTKGKLKTISFPKALVEAKIGRQLLPNETIDHDDRDKTNDDLNNLIIRDKSLHAKLDAFRVRTENVNCIWCNKSFPPSKNQRNKQSCSESGFPAGPFCSKSCIGKYTADLNKGGDKLGRVMVEKEYYTNKD